jgi:hypothetical protein
MKTTNRANASLETNDGETNKAGLGRRYGVGVRTIENWLYRRIITGRMAGGEIVFDVADCDMRLLRQTDSARVVDLQASQTTRGL